MKLKLFALALVPCISSAADFLITNPDSAQMVNLEIKTNEQPIKVKVDFKDYTIPANSSKKFIDASYIRNIEIPKDSWLRPLDSINLIVDDNSEAYQFDFYFPQTYHAGTYQLDSDVHMLDLAANIDFKAPSTDLGVQCNTGEIKSYDKIAWTSEFNNDNDYSQVIVKGQLLVTAPYVTTDPITFAAITSPVVYWKESYSSQVEKNKLNSTQFIYTGRAVPNYKGRVQAHYGDTVDFVFTVDIPKGQGIDNISFTPYDGIWGNVGPKMADLVEFSLYCK